MSNAVFFGLNPTTCTTSCTSTEAGDKPDMQLPAEALAELSQAKGPVFEMGKDPWWSWKEDEGKWGWMRTPPVSQRTGGGGGGEGKKRNKVRSRQVGEPWSFLSAVIDAGNDRRSLISFVIDAFLVVIDAILVVIDSWCCATGQ